MCGTANRPPARWCGGCGHPVPAPEPSADAHVRSRWLVGAVACLAAVLVAGGVLLLDAGDRSTPEDVADAEVATPSDDALDRIRRRSSGEPASVIAPTCVASPDCFAWRLPQVERVTVTGRGTLVTTAPPSIEVRRVTDGSAIWTADARLSGSQPEQVLVSDELVVYLDDDERLVARDVADGDQVWRSDPLDVHRLLRVVDDGHQLRVFADTTRRADPDGPITYGRADTLHAVIAVDAATGVVRWQDAGRWPVAADEVVLIAGDDDLVRAIDLDGRTLWETVVDSASANPLSADGPLFQVPPTTPDDDVEVHRVHDGRVVTGLTGNVIAADHDGTAVVAEGEGGDGRVSLFADDRIVWQTDPRFATSSCDARVQPGRIVVEACDGSVVAFDRVDGEEVGRVPGSQTTPPSHGQPIGPYVLASVEDGDGLTLVDVRDDTEVAHLPPGTSIVGDRDGTEAFSGVDGVLLLHTGRELVALPLPERD